MNKLIYFVTTFCVTLLLPFTVLATNGDNLIGVGAISRSMGGVGIAAPQDAISSTFSNPAAMNSGANAYSSEFDFSFTALAPKVDGKITIGGVTSKARADEKTYTVPAFGFTTSINDKMRFGLAAYGVSGLGVDHRDTELDGLVATNNTQIMIMKVAPTFAFEITEDLSFGFALHVVNSQADLGQGTSSGYGVGGQLGILYSLGDINIGATYLSAINADHDNLFDLDQDGTADDLDFEAPQQFGLGVAYAPSDSFLFEIDGKWINWSDAKGYDDMDWDDQITVAIGAQFKPIQKLALRLGYNYAQHQIPGHNFKGDTTVRVQGKDVNAYGYETLRINMFPPAWQHHVTAGVGYAITDAVSVNLGYMHVFETTSKSRGTFVDGVTPVTTESKVSMDGVDLSLAWRF